MKIKVECFNDLEKLVAEEILVVPKEYNDHMIMEVVSDWGTKIKEWLYINWEPLN